MYHTLWCSLLQPCLAASYPIGFIVAPIIWYDGWEEGYAELFAALDEALLRDVRTDLTFELI